MNIKKHEVYETGRALTKKIFVGEVDPNKGIDMLIDWLDSVRRDKKTTPRRNGHIILQIKFNFSDLSEFRENNGKPLALGITYKKPSDDKWGSRDWHVVHSDDSYCYCRNDKEMKDRGYLKLVGTHKEELATIVSK